MTTSTIQNYQKDFIKDSTEIAILDQFEETKK
jgi:hypothetical protein